MQLRSNPGWKGIVGRGFRPQEFEAHVGSLRFTDWRPQFVVVHNTSEHPSGTPHRANNACATYGDLLDPRFVLPTLLRQQQRHKACSKDLENVFGLPNCIGSTACFSRLLVLTSLKLRLHFEKPPESQTSIGSRARRQGDLIWARKLFEESYPARDWRQGVTVENGCF